MTRLCGVLLVVAALFIAAAHATAQPSGPDVNYDESRVGQLHLPDPLVAADGTRVANEATWRLTRREEILELFRTHVYGRAPAAPPAMRFEAGPPSSALAGRATRREVRVLFSGEDDGPAMNLLVFIPTAALRPVPAFLGLNFGGNHTVLTAHLVCDHSESSDRLLRSATRLLDTRFGITHTTLQIEPADYNIVETVEPGR